MIGEVGVHAGEFDFGHVAGHALGRAGGAGAGVAARGFHIGWFCDVAGEAFRIIVSGVLLKLIVRVVAGDAAKALIVCVVSAAIEHAVRLEADVVDTSLRGLQHRLLETSVTTPAK